MDAVKAVSILTVTPTNNNKSLLDGSNVSCSLSDIEATISTIDPDFTIYGYITDTPRKRKMEDSFDSIVGQAKKKSKADLETSRNSETDGSSLDKTYVFYKKPKETNVDVVPGEGSVSKQTSSVPPTVSDTPTLSDTPTKCVSCIDNLIASYQCLECPDDPFLCDLCAQAHRRVRLTNSHILQKVDFHLDTPSSICSEIQNWIHPYWIPGLSTYFLVDQELTEDDPKISANYCERLKTSLAVYNSRYSESKKFDGESAKTTLIYFINGLMKDLCDSAETLGARTCFVISELVKNGVIEAGYFIEVETLEAMKKLIKSESVLVQEACLLAILAMLKEVTDLKAPFSFHKMKYLEDAIWRVAKLTFYQDDFKRIHDLATKVTLLFDLDFDS